MTNVKKDMSIQDAAEVNMAMQVCFIVEAELPEATAYDRKLVVDGILAELKSMKLRKLRRLSGKASHSFLTGWMNEVVRCVKKHIAAEKRRLKK